MSTQGITSGRAYERLISFSDGITAVAITLLALPLVGIGAPDPGESVWDVVSDNSGAILAFLITFVVVGTMWKIHARVFQSIIGYDTTMFVLNLTWLAIIVVLPWPSSLYGTSGNSMNQSAGDLPGAGLFYWLTIAALSALLSAMSMHAARTPGLQDGSPTLTPRVASMRGAVFAGTCVVIGVTSLYAPQIAQWMPFLLIPVSMLTSRLQRRMMETA